MRRSQSREYQMDKYESDSEAEEEETKRHSIMQNFDD